MIELLVLAFIVLAVSLFYNMGGPRWVMSWVEELRDIFRSLRKPPEINEGWTHDGKDVKILFRLDDGHINWKYVGAHKSHLSNPVEWVKLVISGMRRRNGPE